MDRANGDATVHSYLLLRPLSGQQLSIMLPRAGRIVPLSSPRSQICLNCKRCTHLHRNFCMYPSYFWFKCSGDTLHPPRESEGLYPLQALVQPVALRFKYHFDSERETNRLDKVRELHCPCEHYKPVFSPSGILRTSPMLPMITDHSWRVSCKG